MKKSYIIILVSFFFSFLPVNFLFAQKTKIACIGNSITEGWELPSGAKSYPTVLQDLLGTTDYQVNNYGVSAHSMLKKSDLPYWNTQKYKDALNWDPDILIIKLGTNDAKPNNWNSHKNEFEGDYLEFIKSFKDKNSDLEVYVCYPIPIFPSSNHAGSRGDAVIREMMPILDEIASKSGATIIDLHTPFEDKTFLSDDGLHPNTDGAVYLARFVAQAVCPSCTIQDLPENILTKVYAQDRTDEKQTSGSSVAELDITPLVDNNASTVLNASFTPGMYFEVELADGILINAYSVTGGDAGMKNDLPKSWEFQGKIKDSDTWEKIHEQTDASFLANETKYYLLSGQTNHYSSFRLVINENQGGSDLKLNEWQFFGTKGETITANGGVITDKYNVTGNEGVACLIDGSIGTKYCAVNKGTSFWIQYKSPVPAKIVEYALTSGNDAPERDPVDWILEGSIDGSVWIPLDTQSDQSFSSRRETRIFPVSSDDQYLYFRLNVKKIKSGTTFQLSEWQLSGSQVPRIKIACIGNSITEGFGLNDSRSYPAVLQKNLGTGNFEVTNFGASGRTLLKNGKEFDGNPSSYWDHERYQQALNYKPDIVIIKLGTNDAKAINWNSLKNEFKNDYIDLVNSFKNLTSQPKIYVCYPIPLFGPGNWINDDSVLTNEMIPMITQVAQETGAEIIDLHTPFTGRFYLSDDKVHPNAKGYVYLADVVSRAICPDCNIPALPSDFFIQLTDFSWLDKKVELTTSLNDQDLSNLTDKNATTSLEVDFEKDTWFAVELPANSKIAAYSITFGSSDASNAPKSWTFEGSSDGKTWRKIDEQKNVTFMPNETKIFNEYAVSYTGLRVCKYFRLLISENNGGTKLSLADWQLFGCLSAMENSVMNNGGSISAQYNTMPHEGPANLIDKKADTKYCTKISGSSWWIRYESKTDVVVDRYSVTSANDAPDRDPVDWTLSGSTDGNKWVVLDSRTNQTFIGRYSTMEYSFTNDKPYKYYRLNVTKIGNGDLLQFAEWQLFEKEESSGIENLKASDFDVFVNNGELTIRLLNNNDAGSYRVFSTTGKHIESGEILPGGNVRRHYSSGVYIVELNSSSGKSVTKVVL